LTEHMSPPSDEPPPYYISIISPLHRNAPFFPLYESLLNRDASSAEIQLWLNAMHQCVTEEGVLAAMAASDEFYQTVSGGTDPGFVNNLYKDLRSHIADTASFNSVVQALSAAD